MRGLRSIDPYVPGEQPQVSDIIKLNTNENAYPPAPSVHAVLQVFPADLLRRYSSLTNPSLVNALAGKLDIPPARITTGNGSDDVLALAFQSFFNSDAPVIFPDLTYGFYKVWCELFSIAYEEVPLTEDFSFDLDAIPADCGGIVLANPNAPTGRAKSRAEIEALLARFPDVVVIVDEAYVAFGAESVVDLVDTYENLYVTRTLSKDAALAGVRVGYGVGGPLLTGVIQAVKNSYNPYAVDAIAEALATAATEDAEYYERCNGEIVATREWFVSELAVLGFRTVPSSANFVLTTHPEHEAGQLFEQLKAAHIYVRFFPGIERISNYLRITIGTPSEMERVVAVLKTVITG